MSCQTCRSSPAAGRRSSGHSANSTRFHYLEWGTGTPVILIHGSGGTALNWMMNGLGAGLARTNRVLAIDMRGHGQTVGPDGKRQRRTPNMDLDVLAFMDAHENPACAHRRVFDGRLDHQSVDGARTGAVHHRALRRIGRARGREQRAREARFRPTPKGTAPLDAEARKLYQARQAAEAAKAGLLNANDESQLSSQPVPAAVARPPVPAEDDHFADPRRRRRVRPAVQTRTHRLWRESLNFQRVILRNRGHLSSYMAGIAPELYRDALTNFIVSHNPKRCRPLSQRCSVRLPADSRGPAKARGRSSL